MQPENDPASGGAVGGFSISVVVITLNEEENIAACLESLLRQDYPVHLTEILVVDASQDSTPQIVSRYPRVRYLRAEKGFSRQKNAGLQAAGSELVAFTDADCLVPPDWLGEIARAFQKENLAGVGGNAFLPPGSGYFEACASAKGHPAGGAIGFDANVKRGPEGVAFLAGCNSAFRKTALLAVGGFNPDFQDGGEDVDLSRRLRENGFLIDYRPSLTVFHKPHWPLGHFIRWNIRVGFSKFNLQKPTLLKLLVEPSFVAWPLALLGGLLAVAFWWNPLGSACLLVLIWGAYLALLRFASRPYPLLLRRRFRLRLGPFAVLFAVPFLILVRQIFINWGQLRKWFRRRSAARA